MARRADCGKILVAEDEAINRMFLVSLLESHGYVCVSARDGTEAVAAFGAGGISAVIMDCRMPKMNGLDAVREIRRLENRSGGRVPIIVLTAYNEARDHEDSRRAGADEYLVKPFSDTELVEKVKSAISRSRADESDG